MWTDKKTTSAKRPAHKRISMLEAIVLFGSATLLTYLGYQIRYRGRVDLISGPQPEQITDHAGLAHFAGAAVLRIAFITFIMGVTVFFEYDSTVIWGIYIVTMLLLVAIVVVGSFRFFEPAEPTGVDEE